MIDIWDENLASICCFTDRGLQGKDTALFREVKAAIALERKNPFMRTPCLSASVSLERTAESTNTRGMYNTLYLFCRKHLIIFFDYQLLYKLFAYRVFIPKRTAFLVSFFFLCYLFAGGLFCCSLLQEWSIYQHVLILHLIPLKSRVIFLQHRLLIDW